MCDMLSASIALTVVTTAVSAYSAYEGQKAQNKAADFNAAIATRNAENLENQGKFITAKGEEDVAQHRDKVQRIIGSQRSGFGTTGLLVDEGTASDTTQNTAKFGEMDALTIRNNAALQAWAARNQAADYTAQGGLALSTKQSPFASTIPSLLSGGSKLAGQVYQYKTEFGSPKP